MEEVTMMRSWHTSRELLLLISADEWLDNSTFAKLFFEHVCGSMDTALLMVGIPMHGSVPLPLFWSTNGAIHQSSIVTSCRTHLFPLSVDAW